MKTFPASQLIINADGSAFHLHLKPEFLADKVILVGDQDRVNMVASFFDEGSIECDVQSREFHTITGKFQGKRISCISTGIGTDNCDIVMNEIDALANIDFATRTEKAEKRHLDIVRIGTCGGMQEDIPLGTFLVSQKSIGFDGVLSFYKDRDKIADLGFEKALIATRLPTLVSRKPSWISSAIPRKPPYLTSLPPTPTWSTVSPRTI